MKSLKSQRHTAHILVRSKAEVPDPSRAAARNMLASYPTITNVNIAKYFVVPIGAPNHEQTNPSQMMYLLKLTKNIDY